jgi:hypothetical protein
MGRRVALRLEAGIAGAEVLVGNVLFGLLQRVHIKKNPNFSIQLLALKSVLALSLNRPYFIPRHGK